MSAVAGDIAVAPGGRSLAWFGATQPAEEWSQRTQVAAGFCRGTYRFDAQEGFPSIHLLGQAGIVDQLGPLVRYWLLSRPGTAEVYGVTVTPDPVTRAYTVRAKVRLRGGALAEVLL